MEGNQDADGPTEGQGVADVVNVSSDTIRTVLQAARENRPDVLKRLIEEGMPIRGRDEYDRTALHYAAMLGHPECVRMLLNEKFCEIDAKAYNGMTPLMEACESLPSEGHKQCIKILCEYKANTKMTDHQGETALHIAIGRKPDLEVVKYLVRSWKDSVLDLIGIPWAAVKKRSQISNPISLMTCDSRYEPMMCLFRSESYYMYEEYDDAQREEIDTCVAEVAQYFAKLGFMVKALRAVLTGNIQKPELLETVVECFLERGAVLEPTEKNIQFRPAALSLFAQKSIIFLEGLPTSFEADDCHTHLYNAFTVLIIQGWVSGIVPLNAVRELHDTLKLEPYWGVGEHLPHDFGPLKTLYAMTENPPMLRQLARTKIRTQVAKCNKFSRENLRELPLPETLKDFVQLKDLGDGLEIEKIMKRVQILFNNVE